MDIPDEPGAWQRPIYVDSPEMQDPQEWLETLRTAIARSDWDKARRVSEKFIERKFLLKFKGWDYENEVRVLREPRTSYARMEPFRRFQITVVPRTAVILCIAIIRSYFIQSGRRR